MPSKKPRKPAEVGSRRRAACRYAMMRHRVDNCHEVRNKCYRGIKLKIGREEFIEWFMANDYAGCSVDRIDSRGDYELSNMRLIPTWVNTGQDKLKIKNRKKHCWRCKQYKPFGEMVKSKRALLTGVDGVCKKCDSSRVKHRPTGSK